MNSVSRSAAAAMAGGLALALTVLPAQADEVPIPESVTPLVGMAYDPGNDELWLAGPRADRGVLVEADGELEVSFTADIESIQALAWHSDRLWVGDIGDEDEQRDHIVVYRLGSTEGGRTTYHAYDFRYEEGPRDAKAMLISGRGNVYVVSSGDDPGIYRIRGEASRERMNTLVRVFDAPEGVTDGVFLNDGTTMALRTTAGIEYIDAMQWAPLATETLVGAQPDESITVGVDDELLVGGNPTVRTAQVISESSTTTVTPQPSGEPEPTTSAAASAEPTETPAADGAVTDTDDAPARGGTITALVLAAVVAAAAGLVTYFWRT